LFELRKRVQLTAHRKVRVSALAGRRGKGVSTHQLFALVKCCLDQLELRFIVAEQLRPGICV